MFGHATTTPASFKLFVDDDIGISNVAQPHPATGKQVKALIDFRRIVGNANVLTKPSHVRRFVKGMRFGGGAVEAVVRPGSLVEMWLAIKLAISTDRAVIFQAANTGLTGGSTPWGTAYDRKVVIINVMRLKGVHFHKTSQQVVCLPGATLDALETLLKPMGREPHSVIGSSCIGASVLGGICNNSGGALIRRGPAYTEMALFARVNADGGLELVNNLGFDLGDDPEEILSRVERGEFPDTPRPRDWASDREYHNHVRDVDALTPARFNSDPRRLHDASGCAGKLAVFAVRLDTFESEEDTRVFYIGTNRPDDLTFVRREILRNFAQLPIAGEYIHRDAYELAARYGKDTFLIIKKLGTRRMPSVFALKARFDAFTHALQLGSTLSDRIAQLIVSLLPQHLPKRMNKFHSRYEHHLILKVSAIATDETRSLLQRTFASCDGDFFECDPVEASDAFLHRFAVAGAAGRYRAIHPSEIQDIVALDIALPRNALEWIETLPAEIEQDVAKKLYYGHFFCHVFHQDYAVKKGRDCVALEHAMWKVLDQRGAEYPAEHNVGHLYKAKKELAGFYQCLDPTNSFNPGIGQTSFKKNWSTCC